MAPLDPNNNLDDPDNLKRFQDFYNSGGSNAPFIPGGDISNAQIDPVSQPGSSPPTVTSQIGALDSTPVDLSQGHGVSIGTRGASQQGHEDASVTHNEKAQELLRKALNRGNGVSDEQASTAGLLSLIPTLAGALGGAIIGRPNLSSHARFSLAELNGTPTGIAGGAQMGAQGGELASSQYLKSLQDQANKESQVNQILAGQEFKQADTEQGAANKIEEGGLNAQDAQTLEAQRLLGEGKNQQALEQMKQDAKGDRNSGVRAFVDQYTMAAKKAGIPDDVIQKGAAGIAGQSNAKDAFEVYKTNLQSIGISNGAEGNIKEEDKFRKERIQKPLDEASQLTEIQKAAGDLKDLNNPMADTMLREALQKASTPQARAVRAEFFKVIQQSGNPLNKLQGEISNWEGGGNLNDVARKQIGDTISALTNAKLGVVKSNIDAQKTAADTRGLNWSSIVPEYDNMFGGQNNNQFPSFEDWKKQNGH